MKRVLLLGLSFLLACGDDVVVAAAPPLAPAQTADAVTSKSESGSTKPTLPLASGQCQDDAGCPSDQYCVYPNGHLQDAIGTCFYPSKEGERCEQNQVAGFKCATTYSCFGGGDEPGPGICHRWVMITPTNVSAEWSPSSGLAVDYTIPSADMRHASSFHVDDLASAITIYVNVIEYGVLTAGPATLHDELGMKDVTLGKTYRVAVVNEHTPDLPALHETTITAR